MLKRMPSLSKAAERRLQKAAAKRLRTAKTERARFLIGLRANQATEAGSRNAEQLVKRVRAAKAAPFLEKYRLCRDQA